MTGSQIPTCCSQCRRHELRANLSNSNHQCALWISQSASPPAYSLTFMVTPRKRALMYKDIVHEETIINRRLSDVWLVIENMCYILLGWVNGGRDSKFSPDAQHTSIRIGDLAGILITYGCGVRERRRSVAAMNIISNCVEIHPLFRWLTSAFGCVAWPTHLK